MKFIFYLDVEFIGSKEALSLSFDFIFHLIMMIFFIFNYIFLINFIGLPA